MAGMAGVVRVPKSHADYACERTLVCCGEPTRAPISDAELPPIERALSHTPSLREAVRARREVVETPGGDLVVHAQDGGRCVHLRQDPGRCALHEAGGLDALGLACRNYPRLVTRMPDGHLEVAFNLRCPTASRLLVTSPAPLTWSEPTVFPFPPSREAPREVRLRPAEPDTFSLASLLEWRAAWWRELAENRRDPECLVARIQALHTAPELWPKAPEPGPLGSLGAGATSLEGWLFFCGLGALPDRGPTYDALRWPVQREAGEPVTLGAFIAMAEPVAPVLHAFLDHQILLAGLHDRRALVPWSRTAARRAVVIIRLVDALCHRTPYRLATILADLVSSSTLVEPLVGP